MGKRVGAFRFWVLGTIFSILFAGPMATAAAGPADQVLNWGNGAEPKDLDPHIVTGVPETHILQNLFEPLVSKDPKTLAPTPGVAEKWKLSKDGKVYTFNLRKNAKWSNGEALTAKDFVYSFERLLTPDTAAEYAYQAHYIKNGKAFNEGKTKDASQLGVKAIDDHTLEITLENPTPFFLSLLFHHSLYPVHRGTIEKNKGRWTRPENFIGNGPFILSKWETNKIITLKKSPNYWDSAKVSLAAVNFFPTENLDTEEQMFRTNQLHVTNEVPLEKLPVWQNDKTGVFQSYPYLGTYFYRINVTKPGLKDVRVRKAINLALDRERIIKYVAKGNQVPAQAFTPPETAGYTPKPKLPSNLSRLDEAKKLLVEAGFPGGKGLGPIEIHYNTHEGHKKIAEAVQEMLKQNLGLDIRLFNQEWKVYLDSQRTLSYQLSRAGWIGDYNDPMTFLDMFVTNGGNNNTGWSNAEYDKLIEAAGKELNAKKRLAIFQKAEDILLTELPVIPIYIYKRNYLRSPLVQGWHNNIEDIHPLKFVSLAAPAIAAKR